MAAADDRPRLTLDIPEKQVLVYYDGDAVPYHHRILLIQVEGGNWIWATPDLDVQIADVAELIPKALNRDSPFPDGFLPRYVFDPVSEEVMAQLRAGARALGDVLGVPAHAKADGLEAKWLIADTSNALFGMEVAPAILGDNQKTVFRESCALVRLDDGWSFAERVRDEDYQEWLDEKRAGAGRDSRLNEGSRDSSGKMVVTVKDAALTMKQVDQKGWPFKGPIALVEVISSVIASGHEMAGYHMMWKQNSGVPVHSGA